MLNKLNVILLSILAFLLITAFVQANVESINFINQSPISTIILTPTPTPTPTIPPPNSITITKINLQAGVESLGLDSEGRVDLPPDLDKVGLFSLGPKPGEKGNAFISGHLDTVTGAPAVFYRLSELEVGDEILVNYEDSSTAVFVVYEKEFYERTSIPVDLIFGQTNDKNLNLMTCSGWFDYNIHTYSHRLVVFTKIKTGF